MTAKIKDVLVLCGPSGSGKSTLISRLTAEFPGKFGFCVSHTTRAPRIGEQPGVHYHFSDRMHMEEMRARHEFLETALVHNNMYGTSFAAVDAVRSAGKVCVLDIDVQGVRSVQKDGRLPALYVFLQPPSVETLQARLTARGTESPTKVALRVSNARVELEAVSDADMWDAVFTNDDLDECYESFKTYLTQEFPQILV